MAEQEQQRPSRSDSIDETELAPVDTSEGAHEALEITDDLLDEIDSVLEENAEEMVKNYVQKGGE